MSAQTQKTVLTLGIFGVLIFLAWKIWPTVKRAITGGSSGTGGTSGGVTAGNPYPYQNQPQQQPKGLSFGAGGAPQSPRLPNAPGGGSSIGQWLYGLTHLATLQAGGPLSDPLYGSAAGYDSAALDSYQISANPLLSFTDFSSTPIDSTGGGYATTSYDPSLDNYQFDASSFGGGGAGYFGGIVDPSQYDPGTFDPGGSSSSFDNSSD